MAALKGLVEEMDQLVGILGHNVLRLRVQGVRDRDRDGYVLALIREVPGRASSLGLVLVRLEIVDNRVGVSLRLLLWAAGGCPRSWGFVFPLFNHCVTSVAKLLGSHQSESISNLPCDCLAPVHPYHLLSLVGSGVALLATVPVTAIVLEDSVGHGVITVNWNVEDVSLTSMATPGVMDVKVPLLCLPLEPFCSNETATVVRIKGSLIGGCGDPNTFVGTVDFGLPTTATACVTKQVANLGESGLAIPTSVVLRHLFDVSDQECMALVDPNCHHRPANFVIVGWEFG